MHAQAYRGVPLESAPVRRARLSRGRSGSPMRLHPRPQLILRGSSRARMVLQSQPILRQRGWPLYSLIDHISAMGCQYVSITLAKEVPCDRRQFPRGHSCDLSTADIQGALTLKRRSEQNTTVSTTFMVKKVKKVF